MLTIVDRKSRLVRLRKVNRKTSEAILRETVEALKDLEVLSLTNDNGCEFISHAATLEKLDAPIYFTRPYASWERGSIENTNKLILQYFPKKTNLQEIPDAKIKMVEMLLNHRPQKNIGLPNPD